MMRHDNTVIYIDIGLQLYNTYIQVLLYTGRAKK